MVYSASSEKWGKYCKQIPTNHLIVLCEIEEDFKSFYSDLEKLIKSKWNKDPLTKLYHAMQGKTSMGSHKYNSFIEKHKRTIEIMRRYSCLSNLTILSYDANGIRVDNLVEDYFYQYIQKHKEDIDKIKDVALKIKELGISKINYYEHLDFSQFEYTLDTSYKCEFSFLENMEIIPTYSSNQIKYKTKNSCYCLTLEFSGYGNNKKLSNYGKSIVVNNLVFNPNRLPDKLTSESTIGLIYELAEKEKKAKNDTRNSVNSNAINNDLSDHFENFDNTSGSKELDDVLRQMQNSLVQLQMFGTNFDNEIISSNEDIADEMINKEKRLYLDRKN